MANVEGDELAFAGVQLVQSKFRRKMNHLTALKHSVKDAVAQSQATQKEYDRLEAELENLDSLRLEYEAIVNAFNANFAVEHSEKAGDINKSADEILNASFNIKVNFEILLRKVASQLPDGESLKRKVEPELETNEETGKSDSEEISNPTVSDSTFLMATAMT